MPGWPNATATEPLPSGWVRYYPDPEEEQADDTYSPDELLRVGEAAKEALRPLRVEQSARALMQRDPLLVDDTDIRRQWQRYGIEPTDEDLDTARGLQRAHHAGTKDKAAEPAYAIWKSYEGKPVPPEKAEVYTSAVTVLRKHGFEIPDREDIPERPPDRRVPIESGPLDPGGAGFGPGFNERVVSGTKIDDLNEALVVNAAGGGLNRDATPDYIASKMPVMGGVVETGRAIKVISAAKRIQDGEEEQDDRELVADYLLDAQREGEKSWSRKTADLAAAVPGFAAEFYLTGGASKVGGMAAEKVAQRLLAGRVKGAVRRGIGKAVNVAAGAAAQTLANPQLVASRIAQQFEPQGLAGADAEGRPQFAWRDQSATAASLRGFFDAYTEVLTERAGSGIGKVAGKIAAPIAEVASPLVKLRALRGLRRALSSHPEWMERLGFHGIPEEIGEERLKEVLDAMVGVQPPGQRGGVTGQMLFGDEQERQDALKQLASEAVSFAPMGGAGAVADRVSGRKSSSEPPKGPVEQDAINPATFRSRFNDLWEKDRDQARQWVRDWADRNPVAADAVSSVEPSRAIFQAAGLPDLGRARRSTTRQWIAERTGELQQEASTWADANPDQARLLADSDSQTRDRHWFVFQAPESITPERQGQFQHYVREYVDTTAAETPAEQPQEAPPAPSAEQPPTPTTEPPATAAEAQADDDLQRHMESLFGGEQEPAPPAAPPTPQALEAPADQPPDQPLTPNGPQPTSPEARYRQLVDTDERYQTWSNRRDGSDRDRFVNALEAPLGTLEYLAGQGKQITAKDIEDSILAGQKLFGDSGIRKEAADILFEHYQTLLHRPAEALQSPQADQSAPRPAEQEPLAPQPAVEPPAPPQPPPTTPAEAPRATPVAAQQIPTPQSTTLNPQATPQQEERNKLVLANQGLVYSQAQDYARKNPRVDVEDLASEGQIALIAAAEQWNPSRGKFSTYATQSIRNRMLSFVRGRASQPGATMEDASVVPARPESEAADDRLSRMNAAMEKLSPRHRALLRRYYGLGDTAKETLAVIGKASGVTKQRAGQLVAEAEEALRAAMVGAPVPGAETPPIAAPKTLVSMNRKELMAEAKRLGLKRYGALTNDALRDRIAQQQTEQAVDDVIAKGVPLASQATPLSEAEVTALLNQAAGTSTTEPVPQPSQASPESAPEPEKNKGRLSGLEAHIANARDRLQTALIKSGFNEKSRTVKSARKNLASLLERRQPRRNRKQERAELDEQNLQDAADRLGIDKEEFRSVVLDRWKILAEDVQNWNAMIGTLQRATGLHAANIEKIENTGGDSGVAADRAKLKLTEAAGLYPEYLGGDPHYWAQNAWDLLKQGRKEESPYNPAFIRSIADEMAIFRASETKAKEKKAKEEAEHGEAWLPDDFDDSDGGFSREPDPWDTPVVERLAEPTGEQPATEQSDLGKRADAAAQERAKVAEQMRQRLADARERLKQPPTSYGSVVLPFDPELAKLTVKYLKLWIEEKVFRFADAVQRFIGEFGPSDTEELSRYIETGWNAAKKLHPELDATGKVADVLAATPDVAAEPEGPDLAGRDAGDPKDMPPLTSIKNAVVDELRKARGDSPMTPPERRSWESLLADAADKWAKEPTWINELVAELISNPRPHTDLEVAGLNLHYRRLNNGLTAAMNDLSRAIKRGGSPVEVSKARTTFDGFHSDIREFERAVGRQSEAGVGGAGTEAGRALAARKMLLDDECRLAGTLRRISEKYGSHTISTDDLLKFQQAEARIVELETQLDAAKAELDRRNSEKPIDEAAQKKVEEIAQKIAGGERIATPTKKRGWKEKALAEKDAAVARAKEALAKLGRLGAIYDPVSRTKDQLAFIGAMVDVGKAYVKLGVATAAEFIADVAAEFAWKDLGERKPLLEEAWKQVVRDLHPEVPEVDPEDYKAVRKLVREVLEAVVAAGTTEYKAAVAETFENVRAILPWITERRVREAISDYGQFTPLTKDEIQQAMQQIRGKVRETLKLEDMTAGKGPLATGREMPTPDDEWRALIKQVNEAKKRGGYVVTDPERALKTALGAAKTAIRNQIADLETEIRTGEKIIRERSTPPTDAELDSLRTNRDELKAIRDAMFPKERKGLTEEQRIAAAERGVERAIANLEKDLAEFNIGTKAKAEPLSSPSLDAKRQRLAELRNIRKVLQDELKPAPEERRLDAYKRMLEKGLAELQRRREERDFSKPAANKLQLDKATKDLRFEYQQERQAYKRLEEAWKAKNRTPIQKAMGLVPAALNDARAIMTSYDFSAVGRQAWFASNAHPFMAAKAMRQMVHAAVSQRNYFDVMDEIRQRPNFHLYEESKLALSVIDGPLSKQEEAYMGAWAARMVPGVAQSERAYVAFLNVMRANLFDMFAATLGKSGTVTAEEAKILANFVNIATGRGSLGSLEPAAGVLALQFFSPRYVWSRFQLLAGYPLWQRGATGRLRLLFAKEYARVIASKALFYGVVAMAALSLGGGDDDKPRITFDPRSSDFGKVRFRNTRIDVLGGIGQVIVPVTQLITGQRVNKAGVAIPIRGDDVPYNGQTGWDVANRAARMKFAPWLGTAADLLSGENVIGEKVTLGSAALSLVVPLSIKDTTKTIEDLGVPAGVAARMWGLFGTGVQTYEKGEVGDFRDEMYRRQQQDKDAVETKQGNRIAGLMSDLRTIAKQRQKSGMKVDDLDSYETGLARLGMGMKPEAGKQNPFTAGGLRPDVRKAVDDSLAEAAFTVAKTEKLRDEDAKERQTRLGALAFLRASKVPNATIESLLMAKLREKDAHGKPKYGSEAVAAWRTRLRHRLGE